jgi:hypothetical protein
MQALLPYYIAANNQAAGVVADGVAVNGGDFSIRNNHFILTEPYEIAAAVAFGTTLTAAQIDTPTIDAFNPLQVYPTIAGGIIPPANPNVMDLRNSPIALPMNEEIKFQLAGGAGGAEIDAGIIFIRPTGAGKVDYAIMPSTLTNPRFVAIFTATIVKTAGAWSPFVAITFTNPLRGGGYQMNGLFLVCATSMAFRINFVKAPMYQGRKLFPGGLNENAYGNQILRYGANWLGGLGRFNNFELPQISTFGGSTVGSATFTGYADLTYLGASGADALP